MKKASKILISMLLLVSMLAGYVPAFIQSSTVSAAGGETTYKYVKVNSVQPGKTYIVANSGAAGNFRALSTGTAPSEGSAVVSVGVSGDGSKITASSTGEFDSLEWTFVPGIAPVTAHGIPQTYMLYNPKSGCYLFNPVYNDSNGSSMKLTKDPLSDEHSPYTRQIFRNGNGALQAYKSTSNNMSVTQQSNWVRLQPTSASDPHQYFNTPGVNAGTYNGIVWTMHSGDAGAAKAYDGWEYFLFKTAGGFNERNSGFAAQAGWLVYAEEHQTGNYLLNNIRMDTASSTAPTYLLASIIMTKNIYARVAIQSFELQYNKFGAHGYYPSHRYIFCQYQPTHIGDYGFRIANLNNANVASKPGEQYFYGWNSTNTASASFIRNWNGTNINNNSKGITYFYEKQVDTESSEFRYTAVTSEADITGDAEYMLISRDGSGNAYCLQGNTNGAVSTAACTVANSSYSGNPGASKLWKLEKAGDYYYITNKSTGFNIFYAGGSTISSLSQGAAGAEIVEGTQLRWKVDLTNHRLISADVAYVQGKTVSPSSLGINSSGTITLNGGSFYLYKRTFCSHTNTTTTTVDATCTKDGLTTVTCNDCGATVSSTVIPKLGHDYTTVITPPTCTEQGYTTYTCKRGDETHIADYVPAKGHTWGAWTGGEPTCTESVTQTRTCSVCGEKENRTLESLGHDFGEWTTVKEPTKTEEGLEQRTCSRCGKVEDRTIPVIKDVEVTVESVSTEAGKTVTVPVKISANPGICEQIFAIYYPLSLELVSVAPSGEVYGENTPQYTIANPAVNAKMKEYFDNAGVDVKGRMGCVYYIQNGIENTSADGIIVNLTFKVPENPNCLDEYEIGIFGVNHDINEDAIDKDGNTVEVIYVPGTITVTNAAHCEHTNIITVTRKEATCTEDGYEEDVCADCGYIIEGRAIKSTGHSYTETVTPPTCTEGGYTTHVCAKCGDSYVDTRTEALGHDYDNGVIIKQATGISGIITRYTCRRCGDWYDETTGTGSGVGISHGDQEEYVYRLTDTVLPGHEYIIANSNQTGAALAMADSSTGLVSGRVTVKNDSNGKYIENSDNDVLWTTTVGNVFSNKATNKYLRAFGNTVNAANTSLNIATANSPFTFGDGYENTGYYTFTGNHNSAGYYLGYTDAVDQVIEAAPANKYLRVGNWLALKSNANRGDDYILSSNEFSIEFDMSFVHPNSRIRILRPVNGIHNRELNFDFTPSSVIICVKGNETSGSYSYGSTEYNFKHWNHYKVTVKNNVASVSVNGVEVVSAECPAFERRNAFMFLYPAYLNGTYNEQTDKVGIDNVRIKTADINTSMNVGGTTNTCISGDYYYDFENVVNNNTQEGFPGMDGHESTVASTVDADSTTGEVIRLAENTFIASKDSKNKVYFYEKVRKNQVSEVYTLINEFVSGDNYVLVSSAETGAASLVGGRSANVYCDGVSWEPYVKVSSDNEYTAVKTAGGILISNGEGYLKNDGTVSSALTADCIIPLNGNKVAINGTEYSLYRKQVITAIDTALVNDAAAVDFGWGFTLNADNAFRGNDYWASTVSMTLTAISASLVGGTVTNNYFYPMHRTSGDSGIITLKNGAVTLNGTEITYKPSGKYESEQTFNYEYTIDHLGSYIYGKVLIIPATTVYYEDNESFIKYNDGEGSNAKWESVGTREEASLLLDSLYGNDASYGNYATYSAGAAHKATISAGDVKNTYPMSWAPSAEFTFKGTGFEVFSATGTTTCLIFVEILDKDGNWVYGSIVDNYFGYKYDESDADNPWKPSSDASASSPVLWQVPVIRWSTDTWGEYTVKITASYDKYFDHAGIGYSEFYLDGVRVFNPLGNSAGAEAKDKYMEDKEFAPVFVSLRDVVKNTEETGENRAMFVDGNGLSGEVNVYEEYDGIGANNEISIPKRKGVAFKLSASGAQPAKVSIGAKLISGENAELTVMCGSKTQTINLSTASDMYYNITEVLTWNTGSNGWETGTIIITNSSDAVVSLTTVKFSYESESANSVMLYTDGGTEHDAWTMLTALYGEKETISGDVSGDGKVTSQDVTLLKKIISGSLVSDEMFKAADLNGDGKVNSRDLLLMRRLLAETN